MLTCQGSHHQSHEEILMSPHVVSLETILAENPLFTRLSVSARKALADSFASPICVQGNETVLCEGQNFNYFGIIGGGRLTAIRSGSADRVLEAGSYFGLRSLFTKTVSPVTLVPEKEACVIYNLPRGNFEKVLSNDPSVAYALLPAMACLMPDSFGIPVKAISTKKDTSGPASLGQRSDFKIRVFDTKQYQAAAMREINKDFNFTLEFLDEKLSEKTVHLAYGAQAVCVFVHDSVTADISNKLSANGVELVVYRCAGFDTCDVIGAEAAGLSVARVPSYSPNAIAEHASALMMALNRKLLPASTRVHAGDFTLDGLTGFNMMGKTVGILGTGRIGFALIKIMLGYGCNILCFDKYQSPAVKSLTGVNYVSLEKVLENSDIISLHCLLDETTKHMINKEALMKMKRGVMIINTARGPLIDTSALIDALRSGHVGSCGLDVVEGETEYFYRNCSDQVVGDDNISRLMSFTNNVIITPHQAYLTNEALVEIAKTTFDNVVEFIDGHRGKSMSNTVFPQKH